MLLFHRQGQKSCGIWCQRETWVLHHDGHCARDTACNAHRGVFFGLAHQTSHHLKMHERAKARESTIDTVTSTLFLKHVFLKLICRNGAPRLMTTVTDFKNIIKYK